MKWLGRWWRRRPLCPASGEGSIRILITNIQLTGGSGSEQVTRDLALGLARRGHKVAVYCPNQAGFAQRMANEGVCLVDSLADLPWAPELIHGHHHLETMAAVQAFPSARAIFVCHDGWQSDDHPPRHPRIMRYVAVDKNCHERLARLVPGECLCQIGNWFDSTRFRPRSPLPARPKRALMYGNYMDADAPLSRAIYAACAAEGIDVDVIGGRAGKFCTSPESALPEYDVVFAKGKCAIEALATGCATIVTHYEAGPMVTMLNVALCRDWNFGLRLAVMPADPATILRELRRYDAEDATRVSAYVRESCRYESALAAYERLYREVLSTPMPIRRHDEDAVNLRALLACLQSQRERCRELAPASACAPLARDAMEQIKLEGQRVAPAADWAPGEARAVVLVIQNGSSVPMESVAPAPVFALCQWGDEQGVAEPALPIRVPLPGRILPGDQASVRMLPVAPPAAGRYRLRLTLVQEGVSRFDEVVAGVAVDLVVAVG